MNKPITWLDQFCFDLSGSDIKSVSFESPEIAAEERRIAYARSTLLSALVLVNFYCTALSIYDVFADLHSRISTSIYIGAVVLPAAAAWTVIVLALTRFMMQIGYDINGSTEERTVHLISRIPVWIIIPMFGIVASAPLQVRALDDDIRLYAVADRWQDLNKRLLEIHLLYAGKGVFLSNDCVERLATGINAIQNPSQTMKELSVCEESIEQEVTNREEKNYALSILNTIRNEIRDDGLIARVGIAFAVAPGTAWMIMLGTMFLFSLPVLTSVLAQKRAYEYLSVDRARRDLFMVAGIELNAHVVFDGNKAAHPVTRYHSFEKRQEQKKAEIEAKIQRLKSLKRKT